MAIGKKDFKPTKPECYCNVKNNGTVYRMTTKDPKHEFCLVNSLSVGEKVFKAIFTSEEACK